MSNGAPATRHHGSVLGALREATRSQHATLDAAVDLRAETVTPARYAAFLRAMHAVVAPLEASVAAVQGWAEALPDGHLRRRAADIARDLEALGARDAAGGEPIALPAVATVAQAFGCSYVLEGSTLGGVVLARTLGPALGLSAGHGMAFWNSYGADVGAMWRGFIAALEGWGAGASSDEREAVVVTAAATFDAFLRSVQRAGEASP